MTRSLHLSLDLTYGKIQGFANYKVDRPILFDYDINSNDFPISDKLFNDFKNFATKNYKFTPAQIESERKYIERILRTEFITAAFGSTTSFQVFNQYDDQLNRAIELLPQAKELAIQGALANSKKMSQI